MRTVTRFGAASAVAVLSVIGLIYAAALMDWLERPTGAEPVVALVSPKGLGADFVQCENLMQVLEQKVAQEIDEGRQCSTDAQCQVANFGCPFGCWTAVNRSAVSGIRRALAEYETAKQACGGCVYECMLLPEGHAACEDSQCIYRADDLRPWWMPADKPVLNDL